MATILVRNVDDTVVERLKANAKEHGRSMEAEVRAVLAAAADSSDLKGDAFWQFLRSGPKVTEDFVLENPPDDPIEPNPFEGDEYDPERTSG